MAEIRGLKEVVEALRKKAAAIGSLNPSVIVGYTAAYAIYVHENLEATHVNGQAKFLEQPARELRGELGSIVREALLKGKTLSQALLLAGLRLQRESQQLCPVFTGNLKGSAFTALESEG